MNPEAAARAQGLKRIIARLRRGVILQPEWRRVMREVRRRGWGCLSVCDEAETAFWTYTIGFDETLNHPEIVTSGHSYRVTQDLFGRAYDAIRRGDLRIEDGMVWELCGQGRFVWHRVNWLRITEDWFMFAMYRRWERTGSRRGLGVFQLVGPDMSGLFPWEPGYDERLRPRRPELWRPMINDEVAAGGRV
jgi:hypothetical protein